jgi:hypothetical protein
MSAQIILQLDRSNAWHGLHFERDGKPVSVEAALTQGFMITVNDAPAIATLAEKFVISRDENQK